MGILEINHESLQLIIHSHIFLYGNCISEEVRFNIEEEINTLWNEPRALVWYNKEPYLLLVDVKVFLFKNLKPEDILSNTNPRNNYIRIEATAKGNISYVDGVCSNTGYFLLENLYKGSTTAAHEYGHLLGLEHPHDLDIRGKGRPGIMYPRGTLVDAIYQYDPAAKAGEKGGTMYPIHRRVLQHDVDLLQLQAYFKGGGRVIGKASNKYHEVELKEN